MTSTDQHGYREFRIPMSLDRWALIAVSAPLSREEWLRLLDGLEIMRPGLTLPEKEEEADV